MKFIFDFDDVLFNTSKELKPHIFSILSKRGIPYEEVEAYYKKTRGGEFSLKNFISDLFKEKKVETGAGDNEDAYEEIMSQCPSFINKPLIDVVEKLGKENCYLVTYGEQEFNKAKVERSGLAPLFCEIQVVPGTKKEVISNICQINKDEKIIFVDDKVRFFEDLDLEKCPNLKTILYDEHGLDKILSEMERSS